MLYVMDGTVLVAVMRIASFSGKYRFLSNFYPVEIEHGGIKFPTAEHAYQAAKTPILANKMTISVLSTPGKAKKFGQKVQLRPDWDLIKIPTMREILYIKFSYPELTTRLRNTGEDELIEGNMWGDVFWGVCRGRGENHLGRILMEIREEMKDA